MNKIIRLKRIFPYLKQFSLADQIKIILKILTDKSKML